MSLKPITVIVNSGKTTAEKSQAAEHIREACDASELSAHIVTLPASKQAVRFCEEWVLKAKEANSPIAAAGGDGTINLMAGLCYKHKVTLGIIPLRTFNYFAREWQIPTDATQAAAIIATGQMQKATIGRVEEHVFLNNASFGLYTRLIRQREEASSRFGRLRIIAAFSAAYSLLSRQKLFSITIDHHGDRQFVTTPMVFVGNNTLQLDNLGLKGAECSKNGRLALIVMQKVTRLETARFLLRGLAKMLGDESRLTEICTDAFTVSSRRKTINLVIDGEIVACKTPLKFSVEKDALSIFSAGKMP